MTKARFNLLVLKELMQGRCGCLANDKYLNICFEHAAPVLASLGRLIIAERYGWDRYRAYRHGDDK